VKDPDIKEGSTVKRTEKIVEVPVGDALLGRVVNAIGEAVDGKGEINSNDIERLKLKLLGLLKENQFMSHFKQVLKLLIL
jgi:F-type H+-transporting ATPase subunit alpha